MSKKNHTEGLTRTLSELLKLPTDVLCGDIRVTMIGKSKVKIENYRSILVYSETMIKIQAKNCVVQIEGSQLRIRYYDRDEMEIHGRINNVKI